MKSVNLSITFTSQPRKISVLIVSFGVLLATMSNTPSSAMPGKTAVESEKYLIGICMLTVSLLFTGVLGVLQEKTYKKYGPCWKEGVFYTVSRFQPVVRHLEQ